MKFLLKHFVLVGRVEYSRVGEYYSVRMGERPGAWVILFLIWWIYAAMDLSYCPHVDMVR